MGVYLGLKHNGSTDKYINYLIDIFNRETDGIVKGGYIFFSGELRRILFEKGLRNVDLVMETVGDLYSRMQGDFANNSGVLLDENIPKYLESVFETITFKT
jgi:hypothetical protein